MPERPVTSGGTASRPARTTSGRRDTAPRTSVRYTAHSPGSIDVGRPGVPPHEVRVHLVAAECRNLVEQPRHPLRVRRTGLDRIARIEPNPRAGQRSRPRHQPRRSPYPAPCRSSVYGSRLQWWGGLLLHHNRVIRDLFRPAQNRLRSIGNHRSEWNQAAQAMVTPKDCRSAVATFPVDEEQQPEFRPAAVRTRPVSERLRVLVRHLERPEPAGVLGLRPVIRRCVQRFPTTNPRTLEPPSPTRYQRHRSRDNPFRNQAARRGTAHARAYARAVPHLGRRYGTT